ncbi:hypothetical protein ON010_g17033 [Phytophthora cinnamomi]|nr:hypothetical protein ON010_g17033 [Phytophthora cinnamomi]
MFTRSRRRSKSAAQDDLDSLVQGMPLVVRGFVKTVFSFVGKAMQSSMERAGELRRRTNEHLQANKRVRDQMGDNVSVGGPEQWIESTVNGAGRVEAVFPVNGAYGSARVTMKASVGQGGNLNFTELKYRNRQTGDVIDLLRDSYVGGRRKTVIDAEYVDLDEDNSRSRCAPYQYRNLTLDGALRDGERAKVLDSANRLQLLDRLPHTSVIEVAHNLHEEIVATLLLAVDRLETRKVDTVVLPHIQRTEQGAHLVLNLHAHAGDQSVTPRGVSAIYVLTNNVAAAQRAPTGFNTQAYVCIVVRSAEDRARLAGAMIDSNIRKINEAPVAVVFAVDCGTARYRVEP